ncbi:hypothetical protein EGM51_09820 [Verrucomicrobia bacterium S94]|nr:hypothetical protein EGM51_09820 [Verrucomicrobia bacterium S94]
MPLQILSPWTIIPIEFIDDLIPAIKESIPDQHELKSHDLIPDFKKEGRDVFIVADQTSGKTLLFDFEKSSRWKNTKFVIPKIHEFADDEEIADLIKEDHSREYSITE